MKKLVVSLMLVSMMAFACSSLFAMTESFRNQATAGLFGTDGDDLDAADNIGDGVNVVRKFPKWVLLTHFSNLLETREKIFDESSSNSPNTFYGLMGSSEWFETQLGMPINFAVSYERYGSRMPLLGTDGDLSNATDAVSELDGGNYDASTPGTNFDVRKAYVNYGMTELNITAGYKMADDMAAGLNWKHDADKARYYNEGKKTTVASNGDETTTEYGTGTADSALAGSSEDTFNLTAWKKIDEDWAVKGYVTLGYGKSVNNTASADELSLLGVSTVDGLPFKMDVDNPGSAPDTSEELNIVDNQSGLIFGLAGKVYYKPLYKGNINSKFAYKYKGAGISREVKYTTDDGAGNDSELKLTRTGTHSIHNLDWMTKRTIELDNLNIILGLGWNRNSDSQATTDKYDDGTNDDEVKSTIGVVTNTWKFPIGAELKMKEKWTLRVGMKHQVALSTTTNTDNNEVTSKTHADSRSTSYKYGLGYTWSENLQLDVNSFLQEPAQVSSADGRSSILDLATYRNLAISATVTF